MKRSALHDGRSTVVVCMVVTPAGRDETTNHLLTTLVVTFGEPGRIVRSAGSED